MTRPFLAVARPRFLLLLLLVFVPTVVEAQTDANAFSMEFQRDSVAGVIRSTALLDSAFNPAPRAPSVEIDASLVRHRQTGAWVGGVVGAALGFGFGFTSDNLFDDGGSKRIGTVTVGAMLVGAALGGLLGAVLAGPGHGGVDRESGP